MMKLQAKLDELGYCCPYGYFLINRNRGTKELAGETGLTPRTVRWYKRRIITGTCQCEGYCCSASGKPASTSLLT